MTNAVTSTPFTLVANQPISDAVAIPDGSTPVMLAMPDGWEPATLLTVQISVDGGNNYYDIMNADGTPFNAVVHPGTALMLKTLVPWATNLRVRSGTYQSPTPQIQNRTFILITQP